VEPLLRGIFPDGRKPHSRRLNEHLDNGRVQHSKASDAIFAENDIVRVPYSAYSSDLAPSDFWLFGHINDALAARKFTGPVDLLDGIQAFLDEIQKSELEHSIRNAILNRVLIQCSDEETSA
jgi:hypothetical protein